jgi:prepilin-type N-terminal cleavage/methylation domain-containing protein
MNKRGFTLIELLVVIAIIAILAAMLFPVIGQAKEAAKDSVTLTRLKQMGAGTLLYCNDADDALPLIWQDGDRTPENWTWQGTTEPYTRSWGVYEHPKLPAPSGQNATWERLQYFGALPRIETIRTTATIYSANLGPLTGNQTVYAAGLMGSGTAGMFMYKPGSYPSLAQSQVNNVSDNVLVAESGNWDMLMGVYGASQPFTFCAQNGTWGPGWSPHAGQYVYAGPHARKRTKDGLSGIGGRCLYPDGMSSYVAVDGSAKAVDFRTKMLERIQLADGSWVFKRFWPY